MLSGRGVDRVDDIRRKRYIDNDVQPAFQAIDQLRDLTSEAPNLRGFFGFSQRVFLSNHWAVSADKITYNLIFAITSRRRVSIVELSRSTLAIAL